jgi:hypothetical protein
VSVGEAVGTSSPASSGAFAARPLYAILAKRELRAFSSSCSALHFFRASVTRLDPIAIRVAKSSIIVFTNVKVISLPGRYSSDSQIRPPSVKGLF